MRDPARLRPSVEGLEAKTLLSSFAGVMPHAAAVAAQVARATARAPLAGTVRGSYVERTANPDTGDAFSFGGSGRLTPLGSVVLTGTIRSPGFVANGHSTGTLVLRGAGGSLTLSVTGPPQDGNTPVPEVFHYTIAGGSGHYKGDTGGGYIDLTLTPSRSSIDTLTQAGRFSMQFLTLTLPPPAAMA